MVNILDKYLQSPENIYSQELKNYENNLFQPINKKEILECLEKTFKHIAEHRDKDTLLDTIVMIHNEMIHEDLLQESEDLVNTISSTLVDLLKVDQNTSPLLDFTKHNIEEIITIYSNLSKNLSENSVETKLLEWEKYFRTKKEQYFK